MLPATATATLTGFPGVIFGRLRFFTRRTAADVLGGGGAGVSPRLAPLGVLSAEAAAATVASMFPPAPVASAPPDCGVDAADADADDADAGARAGAGDGAWKSAGVDGVAWLALPAA